MSILREQHDIGCPCSICERLAYAGHRSFGLLTPLDKAWNSWRWLFYVGRQRVHFWRWTGFWQRQPKWRSR